MATIEVEALRKRYWGFRGGTTALDGLDLSVPEGGVFGFLGPNGSGKTTTIRCLLGLVRPTSGSMQLLGIDPSKNLAKVVRRVGAMVETPAFFPRFSGKRNLEYLARIHGLGKREVLASLTRVGLADRQRDLVRDYSLGMKQRLGLAAVLMRDPELLILDEPANGLDPAGITEVRSLLKSLADEGRTIFVSSHILSEVQGVCDRVAILSRGKCVAAGEVNEVLAMGRSAAMAVSVKTPDKALSILKKAGLEATLDSGTIKVRIPAHQASLITRALAEQELYLDELRPVEVSLEEVFLELTADPEP